MDRYPMPVADLLVDAAVGHKVISFVGDSPEGPLKNWGNPA
jgi:hypothetical protein